MKSIRYIAIGLLLAATVLLIWEKISFRTGNKGVQQKRINGITTNADIKTADGARYSHGKKLFDQSCAACHRIQKQGGSGLFLDHALMNEQWADRNELLQYLQDPVAYRKKSEYAKMLVQEYGSSQPPLPNLTAIQLDAILFYIQTDHSNSFN